MEVQGGSFFRIVGSEAAESFFIGCDYFFQECSCPSGLFLLDECSAIVGEH